jgi:sensor histidine kinase YesM
MGSRFRYSVQVPENCASLFFPPLMLISLVENAIKHGVEPKPGACFVTIAARRFAVSGREQLEVSVIDDGAGLREGAGSGIGLANIRAQLAARYQSTAELSLEGRETGGVAARITIPIEQC